MEGMRRLFEEHQVDGYVVLPTATEIFYGHVVESNPPDFSSPPVIIDVQLYKCLTGRSGWTS
jgi:hypothetical protein